MVSLMDILLLVLFILIELDFAWGFQKYICWIKNGSQEPLHTWRTSSIILRFLMVIMKVGVIFIEVDFAWAYQKIDNTILNTTSETLLSGTSPYMEDVLNPPEVPDHDHDGWVHLYWIWFCLRFPKIYNTLGFK